MSSERLNKEEASLQSELAQVKSAVDVVNSGKFSAEANTALAATTLNTPVAGDPRQALGSRQAALESSIASLRKLRADLSDSTLDPEIVKALDNVRVMVQLKFEAYGKIGNARAAVTAAESNIDTSYSFSGGVAGTLMGRVAVTLAFTIVFGLIAIYTLEWLSQVRAHSTD